MMNKMLSEEVCVCSYELSWHALGSARLTPIVKDGLSFSKNPKREGLLCLVGSQNPFQGQ